MCVICAMARALMRLKPQLSARLRIADHSLTVVASRLPYSLVNQYNAGLKRESIFNYNDVLGIEDGQECIKVSGRDAWQGNGARILVNELEKRGILL